MRRFLFSLAATLVLGTAYAQPAAPAALPAIPPAPTTAPTVSCEPAAAACPRAWLGAEWLFWTVQGDPLPALVTGSPDGTPRNQAGVLGAPGTAILTGGTRANDDFRNGLRINAGYWFDDGQKCGLELSYFFLENSRQGSIVGSPGSPIISRPFTSALTGPASELVAFPGVLAGSVNVNSGNQFQGASALLRKNLCCSCNGWVDAFAGYQYFSLDDDLTITENLTSLPQAAGVPAGTSIIVMDRFTTQNTFNGGVLGVAAARRQGAFSVEGRAAVALGNNHRVVTIDGSTTVTALGAAPITRSGGLLAQGTNIGTYTDDVFSVIPELGVKVGWQARECLRFTIGYNWMLWSNVLRAGDQVDLTVNPTQIPPGVLVGPARPAYLARETTVYVHGVSFGAEFRW